MLFRLVIALFPRSKHLLISWLQSPSAVILEPKKIKSVTVSIVSLSICHEVMGPDAIILVFLNIDLQRGDFPFGSAKKKLPAKAGDVGSIPGLRICSGEENANPLQYSCLENPMDRGGFWAAVHGVTE